MGLWIRGNTSESRFVCARSLELMVYRFNPAPLANAKHSAGYLADAWAAYNGSDPDSYLTKLFAEYGINNPK